MNLRLLERLTSVIRVGSSAVLGSIVKFIYDRDKITAATLLVNSVTLLLLGLKLLLAHSPAPTPGGAMPTTQQSMQQPR